MVDRCKSAVTVESETGRTSSQDRRPCEVVAQTPGISTLVSVNAPLQLGGRSNVKVKYPDNVVRDGFDGCIKNLYHNGQVRPYLILFFLRLPLPGPRNTKGPRQIVVIWEHTLTSNLWNCS